MLREVMKDSAALFYETVTDPHYGTLAMNEVPLNRMDVIVRGTFTQMVEAIDWTRTLHATKGRMARNEHDGGKMGVCACCLQEAILEMGSCEGMHRPKQGDGNE